MTKLLDMYEPKGSDLIAQSISKLADNFQTIKGLYGVGKIWISRDSTNPSQIIGGSWEYIEARVLMSQGQAGSGESFSAGATGGSITHRHLTSEGFDGNAFYGMVGSGNVPIYDSEIHDHHYAVTGAVAGKVSDGPVRINYTAHEWHMPPYYVVYMWERKA